jgi:uncharacterized protein
MKIGILSDTHNNLPALHPALEIFRREGIHQLFHCGDLTSLDTVPYFEGFRITYLLGNMDIASGAIKKAFLQQNPDNYVGFSFTGKLDGVSIAAGHSHLPDQIEMFVRKRKYEYIFHGHTHIQRDEMMRKSRIINPGALSGAKRKSICILDLATGTAEFITIRE